MDVDYNKIWKTPPMDFDPLGGPYSDYQLQFLTDLDVAKEEIKKLYRFSRSIVREYEPYQRYLTAMHMNIKDFNSAQMHAPDGRQANHYISILSPAQLTVEEATTILDARLGKFK